MFRIVYDCVSYVGSAVLPDLGSSKVAHAILNKQAGNRTVAREAARRRAGAWKLDIWHLEQHATDAIGLEDRREISNVFASRLMNYDEPALFSISFVEDDFGQLFVLPGRTQSFNVEDPRWFK